MKRKLVLSLLALVVAASGCVNTYQSNDQPTPVDPKEDPYLNTSNIDHWNFEVNEIAKEKTLPDTHGYWVDLKGHQIYLPGTDGHKINVPQKVTLEPGDYITVEKFGNDAEFKGGAYTYKLKSQNCNYEKHETRQTGRVDIKKCSLSFDLVNWEKKQPPTPAVEYEDWDCGENRDGVFECSARKSLDYDCEYTGDGWYECESWEDVVNRRNR